MTPRDVLIGLAQFAGVLASLWCFLFSLDLMGVSFQVIAGDAAGSLFGDTNNPFLGLTIGILATVLFQSSSTTTSIVVTTVGAGIITVPQAVFLIFGANIGTSVTNTIVSLGFINNREQMRRGFAGATVHDMFNYLNVCLLFPLEALIGLFTIEGLGPLGLLADQISGSFIACKKGDPSCVEWKSPFKELTVVSKEVLDVNKDLVTDYAVGRPSKEMCAVLFNSTSGKDNGLKFKEKRCFENATELGGLTKQITNFLNKTDLCDAKGKKCSAVENACLVPCCKFAQPTFRFCSNRTEDDSVDERVLTYAQDHYDAGIIIKGGLVKDLGEAGGWLVLLVSLVLLMISLFTLVKVLGMALRGKSEEWTKKILNFNPYLNIVMGTLLTIAVQSSSVTTSVLTPLAAMGVVTLESMLPFTLGANIGTTVTGVLAALVGEKKESFTIALVHVLFNVIGVFIWYPIPAIRNIPLSAARNLGDLAATYKGFPFLYIALLFFVYPGLLLLCFIGLLSGDAGGIAGGVIGLLLFLGVHAGFLFWYKFKDGRSILVEKFGAKDTDFAKNGEETGVVNPLDKEDA